DVGLSDAGLVDGAISTVGPHGVDGGRRGRDLVVVADEASALEEAAERIPGHAADPAALPGGAVVAGDRLPRVDVRIRWVTTPVEPDSEEFPVLVRGDGREELVLGGRVAHLRAQELCVRPGPPAAVRGRG